MSEWKPIETAPHDGRPVHLGWLPNGTLEYQAFSSWLDGAWIGDWTPTHWKPVEDEPMPNPELVDLAQKEVAKLPRQPRDSEEEYHWRCSVVKAALKAREEWLENEGLDDRQENIEMLREALGFYASHQSWQRPTLGPGKHMSMAFEDSGMRARVALDLEEASHVGCYDPGEP